MIPKVIHYCWFGNNPLSSEAIKCIESWKKFCPDFEIVKWDETNFDYSSCQYAREAYKKGKWAFVSDYARFKILYDNGGVYLDTDVELIREISDLLECDAFMACESGYNRHEDSFFPHKGAKGIGAEIASGLGMGCVKGFNSFGEIIRDYQEEEFLLDDALYNKATVVNRITEMFRKKGFERNVDRIQKIDEVVIYPRDYLSGIDNITGLSEITANTRAIHHGAGSWVTGKDKVFIRIHKDHMGHGRAYFYLGCLKTLFPQLLGEINKYGFRKTLYACCMRLKTGKKIGIC